MKPLRKLHREEYEDAVGEKTIKGGGVREREMGQGDEKKNTDRERVRERMRR